ncbi:UbiA family prenyltransferase [Haloarculaceae archaeon H-GB2-1]|nr:UbiA family prenyltransferase [Haloarculaceae archaeon H-GB1-1]MEA5386311.1 UbiA family prenyltransferase [Haloarculaceae archaeon H-GB11]MEA5407813.1 UbiA family prenyltransferase [Haloarculaceae archaeon H-GB2-1]
MPVSRHGTGPRAATRAFVSQIHPVFMLPPIATAWFGAALAESLSVTVLLVHSVAVFAGLYTAHVKDGYVDFYGRGEDDDHPLTARGCRIALAGSTAVFVVATAVVGLLVDVVAVALMLPGWVIGFLHAPQLDTNPVTATTGYPLGIAFALLGGYYVQARTLSPLVVSLAAIFLLVLSGIKAIDDATDYDYDRSIDKRTAAVVLGPAGARRVAYGLMAVGMLAVLVLAFGVPAMPTSAAFAPVVFAAVAAIAYRADAELATMLLIRGSYLFLAVLVVAVGFRPLG